ncbi:MAG: adenine deaminase [Calditrichaeota bacterium]|nr:adenine deaminase [Calditrichota bacterium]MBT7617152.1 adenine deaminase [Calditrichota bacterium]MBT7787924.1 adenine deaminase [Calditrichota bacterium]
MRLQARLAAARGDRPVDLLLENGQVINVLSGKIERSPVAVFDGVIVGFGKYDATENFDLEGSFLSPGFIEPHIHIESSKLTPSQFAEVVLRRGTTTVIADPHEIANVLGIAGIKFMIENSRSTKLDIFFMLPSCVPATTMETSGAKLSADDLKLLIDKPQILGIGEMMNFPGAVFGDPEVLSKAMLSEGKRPIDGHAPGLSGKDLSAYLLAGPMTDHECTVIEEAREKLARGMRILIREGSTARNLKALISLINPTTERRIMFATDDRRPGDLRDHGHLDFILRQAVGMGLDPLIALRLVTLNPSEMYNLKDRGAIIPGAIADLVALNDLKEFEVKHVWKRGTMVSGSEDNTSSLKPLIPVGISGPLPVPEITYADLQIEDKGCEVRVIGLVPDQIVTENLIKSLPASNGFLQSDPTQDIVKLVVVERHTGSGGKGIGFLKGMGIRGGAIGSTVAHDSHNIIVAGDNDKSIISAIRHLTEIGGGQVVTAGEEILADLALPIAGLMTDESVSAVSEIEEYLIEAAKKFGCKPVDPFMALSFLALPVIPSLKLTDKGLVDVDKFQPVSLYL